jgi:hypothetical protein
MVMKQFFLIFILYSSFIYASENPLKDYNFSSDYVKNGITIATELTKMQRLYEKNGLKIANQSKLENKIRTIALSQVTNEETAYILSELNALTLDIRQRLQSEKPIFN